MKNLLAYTNPYKRFDSESDLLVKIHIKNSFELGWKAEDILLYTNFEYEYMGVKSIVVSGELQCRFDKSSNKIVVIDDLLKKKQLPDNLYWYHDIDAYQNSRFTEKDLGLDGFDLGLTDYGYKNQWNGGSIFFRPSAGDIFTLWCEKIFAVKRTRADEKSMTDMTRSGEVSPDRYKGLNITYNFGMRHTRGNYERAEKPLKVLHFHPYYDDIHLPYPTKETFMYGKNPMGIPLMSDRLISLFHHYGIK